MKMKGLSRKRLKVQRVSNTVGVPWVTIKGVEGP